ncbi:MAG: TetR/AcrR family transcriptional regulator, partial [Mycobacterium sp.]
LQIVDEEGADALSMRALAQRLGSGTATLYRHIAGRAELVAHVVDRVFGEVEFDVERLTAMPWQQACETVAHATFDALHRHRKVAPLLVERVPIGPNAMTHRERCVAVLLDNGFRPQLAAHTYATLARHVLGFAIQLSDPSANRELDDAKASAVFHGLDASLFPATVAVADWLPVPLADEFAFGLELIIEGLSQLHDDRRRRRGVSGRG